DDNPAVSDQSLDNHMFASPIFIQEKKTARTQTAALSKVHKGIRCRAADLQELLVIEGIFRVARGKRFGVRGSAARGATLHPCEPRARSTQASAQPRRTLRVNSQRMQGHPGFF